MYNILTALYSLIIVSLRGIVETKRWSGTAALWNSTLKELDFETFITLKQKIYIHTHVHKLY